MPEYMDYNDFDDRKTKGKRIRSTIVISLSVAWLLFLVILIVIRNPENVRTKFESVKSNVHVMNEKAPDQSNQFIQLNNDFEINKAININEDFKGKYPDVYNIINFNKKEIAKKQVYSFDGNGYFTLAIPYIVSIDSVGADNFVDSDEMYGILGVDLINIGYTVSEDKVTFHSPLRFSLRYYNKVDKERKYVESNYVETKSFKLNFYSLSFLLTSNNEIDKLNYELSLTDPLNKKESEKNLFSNNIKLNINDDKQLDANVINGNKMGDNYLSFENKIPSGNNQIILKINFDDLMYRKYQSLTIKLNENDAFAIIAN